MKHSKLVL